MADPFDPYAPPLAEATEARGAEMPSVQSLREIVLGWEKLRILYNGLLLLPGLIVLFLFGSAGMFGPLLIANGIFVAIGANVCFLLGPLAELYLCALFRREPKSSTRKVLFGLGVGGSLVLFAIAGLVGFAAMQVNV